VNSKMRRRTRRVTKSFAAKSHVWRDRSSTD